MSIKRRDLERHLRDHGAYVLREGAGHSIWLAPRADGPTATPRHREIRPNTARAICDRLGVPRVA